MPHVATTHARHYGDVVDDGHCVAFVRQVTGLPHTSHWRRGDQVRGSKCAAGTAIATFDLDGSYGNHTDGRSHAAILLSEYTNGLLVLDQYIGQPVHERVIRFRAGGGDAANDGDRFHIIELS